MVPKKITKKKRFIEWSKEISEAYEISISIFETLTGILTYLYAPAFKFSGEIKKMFQNPVILSDGFFLVNNDNNSMYVFRLDTCDIYVDGRKIP